MLKITESEPLMVLNRAPAGTITLKVPLRTAAPAGFRVSPRSAAFRSRYSPTALSADALSCICAKSRYKPSRYQAAGPTAVCIMLPSRVSISEGTCLSISFSIAFAVYCPKSIKQPPPDGTFQTRSKYQNYRLWNLYMIQKKQNFLQIKTSYRPKKPLQFVLAIR